jgi:hypothetical protein
VDERERRIGQNEALFREVNERVERLNVAFQTTLAPMQLLCECGNADCFEQIEMTIPEYEHLRQDPHLFAVKPGHETAEVERVVERGERYCVVRKHLGEPAELAEDLDPRTDS